MDWTASLWVGPELVLEVTVNSSVCPSGRSWGDPWWVSPDARSRTDTSLVSPPPAGHFRIPCVGLSVNSPK